MLHIENVCEKALQVLWSEYLVYDDLYYNLANVIKSPIEQIFYAAMKISMDSTPVESIKDSHADFGDVMSRYFRFIPQYQFDINGKKYIADFALLYRSNFCLENYQDVEWPIACIIECDGHDFHEKTKQQAARDKKRDRDFLSQNIPTFRFTGSEINLNPSACVDEVINYASRLAENKVSEILKVGG